MKQQVWRRGLPFAAEVAPFLRHMPQVDEHREGLMRLQGVWDSLALLGQMSGAATEIADTRSAFQALTGRLLDSLARRQLDNVRRQLRGRAQVAIDILVRNLFERTADVGFLAADAPLAALVAAGAAASPEQRAALEARFRAYVAKYSVYDDIVVLSPQGLVLARLDRRVQQSPCADPLIAEALRPGTPFVERHGPSDILGGRSGLLFACAIAGGGVLCLSFKLEDEMRGVFGQLLGADDRSVLALTDAEGGVVLSSDPWQLPAGARLRAGADGRLVFAGRDYLAQTAVPSGYEGYMGPGWSALALLPLEHAFGGEGSQDAAPAHAGLAERLDTRDLFDAELRSIPQEAQRIQRDLSRSLWNGKLRSRAGDGGRGFAITLLNEVERTGQQLRQTFEQAIGNLHHAALDAVFDAARFHARLAIDIMDRNLYERANDCRWWALDAALQQALAADGSAAEASARLQHINGLYTVYALLLVFDAEGRVVAVSDPAQRSQLGRRLEGDWVRATLALSDCERYAVSAHAPSGLYGRDGAEPTYVYAAAMPAPDDAQCAQGARGGIAVVFDGQPQFAAMLRDALPAGSGAAALLVNRAGRVVASTDKRWPVGSAAPLDRALLDLEAGASAQTELELDGVVHAVGLAMSGGYREYRRGAVRGDEDVAAVMLMPLGARLVAGGAAAALCFEAPPAPRADEAQLDIASFLVDGQVLGLPARQTLEALERARLTGLPGGLAGSAVAVAGLLEYQGRMLPVLDLGQLLYGRACGADAPVLVCCTESGRRLGLRVQELGQVFAVAAQAVRASPLGPRTGAEGAAPGLVRGGEGSTAMLTLLSADELWRRIGGAADALMLPDALLTAD